MSILLNILLLYAAVLIGLQVLFFVSVFVMDPVKKTPLVHQPHISILIAARNEEQNIWNCLQSIIEMDYPHHKIEVLIGNDNSTDNTEKIVQQFIAQNTTKIPFIIYNITKQLGEAKAKANVLAHLAHQAKADFFLVTDADITVNKNWAKYIVNSFTEKTGIISGTTVMKNDRSVLQKYDWLYFSSLLKAISNFGIPVTAVGNNMAVKRDAYFATGGYEAIEFSITEDLALYKAIRKQGYKSLNLLDRETLNFTQATDKIPILFSQRKRWLVGAASLGLFTKITLFYYGIYPLCLILLSIINWKLGLLFFCIKYIIQSIHIIVLSRYLKQSYSYIQILVYEYIQIIFNLALAIYYILPIKYVWKEREY